MALAKNKKYVRKKNIIQRHGVPMLSVKRISDRYGFHPHTVRSWVTRDRLKHVRHGPGGKIFIRQDYVEAFIKEWYEEGEEE